MKLKNSNARAITLPHLKIQLSGIQHSLNAKFTHSTLELLERYPVRVTIPLKAEDNKIYFMSDL
jgi:hypothetical protein